MLGLGNPGERYERTRHNVGARVVETLVGRWKARPGESTPEYRVWEASPGGKRAALLRTRVYMNESGAALAAWGPTTIHRRSWIFMEGLCWGGIEPAPGRLF